MKLKVSFIALSLLLSGCASHTPTNIILNPQLPVIDQQTLGHYPISINTVDTRTANYIVKFNNNDRAAKLVSPGESPRLQLDQTLHAGFTKAGYDVNTNAKNHIEVKLRQLVTLVDETTFGYKANSNIVINIVAHNTHQTLTKQFKAHSVLEGSFSVDYATLELQLNDLLLELNKKIINDVELNQFIQN